MTKRVLIILVFLLLLNTIVINAGETITLRIAWWGSHIRHEKTLAVIELFEERNPGVIIEPVYTGWREYYDRIATMAASGNLPDIIQQDYKYFASYNNYNLLLDLDSYIDNTINISDVNNTLLNSGKINGNLYGIPAGINTYTILYDPERFEEAGIEEPSYDWNWEEYMDICRKLHKRLGIYAATSLPMATTNITGLEHYVRQHGQSLFASSSDKIGFSKKVFADFYKMDLTMTNEGVFAPADLRLENNTVENDLIVNGGTVMAAYWANQIVAISNAAGRPLKMLTFPNARNQVRSGYYLKPSMYWTITKSSKHPEVAAKFIDFIINDKKTNEILNADRGVPVSAKIRNLMEPGLDKTEQRMFDFIKYISANSSIIDPPPPAQYEQVIEILEEIHYRILAGVISPEDGYEELKAKANKILSNN